MISITLFQFEVLNLSGLVNLPFTTILENKIKYNLRFSYCALLYHYYYLIQLINSIYYM